MASDIIDFKVKNGLVVSSTATVLSTSSSTSTNTGALIVAGGVGIGGDLNVGGHIIGGGVRSTTGSSPPTTSTVGDIWYDSFTDVMYRYDFDGNGYYWVDVTSDSITNGYTGGSISGNIIPSVNNFYDLGSPSFRFKTLYVSSSTIDLGGCILTSDPNGQLLVDGVPITAGTSTAFVFTILSTASSTSSTTGALIVGGGAGVAGNIYVGGTIHSSGAIYSNGYVVNTGTIINTATALIAFATTASNIVGGAINNVPYQSGTGTTVFSNNFTFDGGQLVVNGGVDVLGTVTATIFVGTFQGNITGATSATVTFNSSGLGSSSPATFNGSGNVTVSYNTLGASPNTGSYQINTVGTVTTGTWNAGTIDYAYGGTGLTSTPANGQIDIGNGTGFTRATITSGTGIVVTNGTGSITISNFGVTSFRTTLAGLTPAVSSTGSITLGGVLGPSAGGLGAQNLTGYLYGNGGSTATASTTIPGSVIVGQIGSQATSTQASLTFSSSGNGGSPGTTFNGYQATTISYNSVGASPLSGSTSLTTVGTLAYGTWTANVISSLYGGTGINNQGNTLTLGSNVNVNQNLGTSATVTFNALSLANGTGPQLTLSGGTSNWINFSASGVASPVFTTRSAGSKLVLYENISSSSAGYAIGVATNTMWFGADTVASGFAWYSGITQTMSLSGSGVLTVNTFSGSGANLTNLPASSLTGTIPSGVLGNSSLYIGTTAVPLNAASGSINTLAVNITGTSQNSNRSTSSVYTGILGIWDTSASVLTPSFASTNNRTTISNPNAYVNALTWEFKSTTAGGINSGGGNYAGVMTLAPWLGTSASGGDSNYQLAVMSAAQNSTAAPTLKVRAGIDTTWGAWNTILTSANSCFYPACCVVSNLTAGTGITFSAGTTYNGSTAITACIGQSVCTTASPTFAGLTINGTASATCYIGCGNGLTCLTAGNLCGTIPSGVLGNSSLYIGSTAVPLNASNGSISCLNVCVNCAAAAGSSGSSNYAVCTTYLNISGIGYATAYTQNYGNTIVARDASGNISGSIFCGQAVTARYGDLAEIYRGDQDYPPGTVVKVGGACEITAVQGPMCYVLGVISTNPGYLMNTAALEGLPVALVGRIPTKLSVAVKKGDPIYPDKDGSATNISNGREPFGFALEDGGPGLVECVIK